MKMYRYLLINIVLMFFSLTVYSQETCTSDTLKYSYMEFHEESKDSLRGQKYDVKLLYSYPNIYNNKNIKDTVALFIFRSIEYPNEIKEYLKYIIINYKNAFENETDYVSSYYEERSVKVLYNQNNILTMQFKEIIYNGGAHPQTVNRFKCFKLDKSEQFELTDLFSSKNYFELISIAEVEFYNHLGLDKNKGLKEQNFWFKGNKFQLNNNFYLNSLGLHFYFNTYEIRAYGYGPTDFLIPWSKIKHLLKDNLGI